RVAEPTIRRYLRGFEATRIGEGYPGQDRPGGGRLFFWHEGEVDPRSRGGGPGRGGAGRIALRNHRYLAPLEIDRGKGPCHRLQQRLPHLDVQYPHPGLG